VGKQVSRERRRELGHILIAVAVVIEAQALALARLQGVHMTQLMPRERKALRAATMILDRSVCGLRVLGNHLEQS
jgi:hypothetical protein